MSRSNVPRRHFLFSSLRASGAAMLAPSLASGVGSNAGDQVRTVPEREQWLALLERVSNPVLEALNRHELRLRMPVEASPGLQDERAVGTHLEAFARLLAGLAPWLELQSSPEDSPREAALRARYLSWCQQAIASALESGTRARLIAALERERAVQAPLNNWLLFAALNEVLLRRLGAFWDRMRIDHALREHQSWYLGDGTYGDGPQYHADFYNSFVIHPYLLSLMDELRDEPAWSNMTRSIVERARRYAVIQERCISSTGEFPVLGRSITYRGGAFHLLADVAHRHLLPSVISPAGVRCALTAVQQRTLSSPGTFSPEGWLQIGLAGHQPSLGERYISTGSLYLCSAAWLPLGLNTADPFWSGAAASWTQKSVWSGHDAPPDHAMDVHPSKT